MIFLLLAVVLGVGFCDAILCPCAASLNNGVIVDSSVVAGFKDAFAVITGRALALDPTLCISPIGESSCSVSGT